VAEWRSGEVREAGYGGSPIRVGWSTAADGAALADEAVAAGGAIALGDDGVGLGIGGSAADGAENLWIGEAGVAQLGGFGAGEDGLAGIATARHGQNHFVGKARELHGLGLTGTKPQLIEASQSHDRWLLKAGTHQPGDGLAVVEGLAAAAGEANKFHAVFVGDSGLAGKDELFYFVAGDFELAQFLDAAEHAGLVQR